MYRFVVVFLLWLLVNCLCSVAIKNIATKRVSIPTVKTYLLAYNLRCGKMIVVHLNFKYSMFFKLKYLLSHQIHNYRANIIYDKGPP